MDWLAQRCPPLAAQSCLRPGCLSWLLVTMAFLLSYPMLRTISLQLHSAVTGSYLSGTHSVAFVNCPNEQIARDIARTILDKKLAACVNILPRASSLDRAQGFEALGILSDSVDVLCSAASRTHRSCYSVAQGVIGLLLSLPGLYFWKGEIEEATEILLLVKTKTSKIHELSNYIRSVHPFEIPELFSLPIDQGNPLYLKWIEEGVAED